MPCRIAGIDVHKKMLAVVVADVECEGEYQFERRQVGSTPEHLRLLSKWLVEQGVEEVVMESTAQYWQPVWGTLERYWKPTCQKREGAGPMSGALHLAQAQSNRGPRGRKKVLQLCDALDACRELHPVYRRLLKMALEELQFLEQQIVELKQEMASLLSEHQEAVQRLAEVPGLGVDSAQQIIAEVGAKAATFASQKHLSSWVGACPGDEESAGVGKSHRSPKGNRHMRRILNQCANAAVKTKGSIFEILYRRLVLRLGHNQTIGAIANRLCRLIWIILHRGVRYQERGPAVCEKSTRARIARMIRELRSLGYQVQAIANPA
jgi:hypothetical protein